MLNALILGVVVVVGAVLIWPRVANATLWRATVTPLASIIGSGFLVLGPILDVSYGGYAPLVMIALCAVAYLFGHAIRFNIAKIETETAPPEVIGYLEEAASVVLAFAFIVSVAYYLNLFGAFGMSLTPFDDPFHAKMLTTAVFAFILCTGLLRWRRRSTLRLCGTRTDGANLGRSEAGNHRRAGFRPCRAFRQRWRARMP